VDAVAAARLERHAAAEEAARWRAEAGEARALLAGARGGEAEQARAAAGAAEALALLDGQLQRARAEHAQELGALRTRRNAELEQLHTRVEAAMAKKASQVGRLREQLRAAEVQARDATGMLRKLEQGFS